MFLWLELRRNLPTKETNGDEWAAETLLAERFKQHGVFMSTGKQYASPVPGYFRLIHSVSEVDLRKGIER